MKRLIIITAALLIPTIASAEIPQLSLADNITPSFKGIDVGTNIGERTIRKIHSAGKVGDIELMSYTFLKDMANNVHSIVIYAKGSVSNCSLFGGVIQKKFGGDLDFTHSKNYTNAKHTVMYYYSNDNDKVYCNVRYMNNELQAADQAVKKAALAKKQKASIDSSDF